MSASRAIGEHPHGLKLAVAPQHAEGLRAYPDHSDGVRTEDVGLAVVTGVDRQLEYHHTIMCLLTERRDDLVAEHTRWTTRLHVLLRDLYPGGAEVRLSSPDAWVLLNTIRPVTAADHQRMQIDSSRNCTSSRDGHTAEAARASSHIALSTTPPVIVSTGRESTPSAWPQPYRQPYARMIY